jgi:hypothetical protein
MAQTIQEVFKQFCKERHAEDKGKNHDLLQEVYASTEFFDTTLYKFVGIEYDFDKFNSKTYMAYFPTEDLCIPFQNNFIKIEENKYVFLREYAPDMLTGTMYIPDYIDKVSLNIPFRIEIGETTSVVISDFYVNILRDRIERIVRDLFVVVISVCKTLSELSKKAIVEDRPTNPNLHEYYRRKRKSTLKVPQRPIYYILGEKHEEVSKKYKYINAIGNLEYSFCFRVRGHWRHINEGTLGKDRNGNYNVKGYTWVTEYTKGEGELAKRIRVIE